jgi:hypothetical protein
MKQDAIHKAECKFINQILHSKMEEIEGSMTCYNKRQKDDF